MKNIRLRQHAMSCTKTRSAAVVAILGATATFGVAFAQPAGTQQQPASAIQAPASNVGGPPIRVLGAPMAVTAETLTTIYQVRALSGGRVLVNENSRRRLTLFDSAMKIIKVVADSNTSMMNTYGLRPAKLLPYHGDSSILIEPSSYSMLVIDGEGNIVKVKAVPRTDHATYYGSALSSTYGNPGFDAQGRLVYRINDPSLGIIIAAGGGIVNREQPDSAPVLRLDFVARKYDTVGRVKIQKRVTEPVTDPAGYVYTRTLTNPMPVQDDWAVTSDGAVAFIRHRDYSIDWINPDGSQTSTPPMPFDWQRLTDEHKKAFIDSLRTASEEARKRSVARYDSINLTCFNLKPGDPITPAMMLARGRGAAPPPPPGTTVTTVTTGADGGRTVVTTTGARAAGAGDGRAAGAGDGRAAAAAADARAAAAANAGRAGGTGPGGRGGDAAASGAATGAAPPVRPAPAGATPAPGTPTPVPVPTCPSAPYPVAEMYGPTSMPSTIPHTALPDYKPPFGANSTRPDADGNIWIRVNQMKPVPGTYHYDVVNRQGQIIDRIQMPIARTIVGFAPGNIIYTTTRQGLAMKLERTKWR